jgi:hypothetical protein
MLGDEFPSPFYTARPVRRSPLMADVAGADLSNWSSDARPPVTAWEGADMDAYWLDNGTWRHCRTGEAWEGEPVNLLDATRAAGHRPTLNTVADFLCAVVASSTSLDVVNEDRGESYREAAE